MNIERSKGVSLYHQLEKILIDLINKGILKENDRLPSERELCKDYNVSRTTARQAVTELERKGYIFKVHGKGTFVSPKVYKQQLLKFYSFTEEMKKINKNPSSKILSFKMIRANDEIRKKLNDSHDTNVYKITRLRLADEDPIMIETTYLPLDRFNNLTEDILRKSPMYDIFREVYSVNITKAIESFKPIIIDNKDADKLGVNKETPAMRIERVTLENENVVEYTISVARGDKFEYIVTLK